MRKFTDNKGRDWHIDVFGSTLKDVKDALGVDLSDIRDGSIFERLGNDLLFAGDVAFWLCQPQIKERQIDYREFQSGLSGDALGSAITAIGEAIIDYFPKQKRDILLKAYQRVNEIQTAMNENIGSKLDDPTLNDAIMASLKQA